GRSGVGGRDGEATGRSSEGSVAAGTGGDHRSRPSAGAVGACDRLDVSRRALCQRMRAGSRSARLTDALGGGAVHSEDGVFGRPVSLTQGEVLRFGLMVDVVCV